MSIVIAYKYEADIHCVNCARLRFEAKKGQRADGNGLALEATDREGNDLGVRFTTDEVTEDIHCGSCGDEIVTVSPTPS